MNTISDEQAVVLNHVKNGHNVVVNAVAGSGKSTTILSIAKALPNRKIIQFTYNSMLRFEIKNKTVEYDIANLDVHTYHSFAVKYYHSSAYTDTGIRHIMSTPLKPRIHLPKKDIIVIDEAQDMTPLYFFFISKYAHDMNHMFQLIVLGDFMQGLYEFKGADIRFLTLASRLWDKHPLLKTRVFHACSLQTSYRITNQMAHFVNVCLLNDVRLHACRNGPRVTYIRNTQRNIENTVIYIIQSLLSDPENRPSDIFILGASVKGGNSPIRRLENALVSRGIPCFVPMIETADCIDDKVIQGKIVFSTFHSVKGRQRKYVFVVGFDQGYMRFYGRKLDPELCPSTIYVACTRATNALYLMERADYNTDKPLEFLKCTHFDMKKMPEIDFRGMPYYPFYETPLTNSECEIHTHYVTPSELIKFISENVLEAITPILESVFIVEKQKTVELDIPTMVETMPGIFEDVSDLNGLAIPAMYYDYLNSLWGFTEQHNVLYESILLMLDEFKENEHGYLKHYASLLPKTFVSPAEYTFLANVYVAFQEKLYFKLQQIPENGYNWLTDSMFAQCKRRLNAVIKMSEENPMIEKTIIHQSQETEHACLDAVINEYFYENVKFRFTARVDIIAAKTVWELKCVKEITMDHKLQLIIYAWLYLYLYPNETMDFKLFNIRTNEILKLNADKEHLDFIVISLLQGKYQDTEQLDDNAFMEMCTNKEGLTTANNSS